MGKAMGKCHVQGARMQWEVAMGKAMGKVPWARCHVQGAMCKVVRQVHSTVVRLPDQTCLIRWPQVGPSDTAVRSPAAETASCLFKQAGSREET